MKHILNIENFSFTIVLHRIGVCFLTLNTVGEEHSPSPWIKNYGLGEGVLLGFDIYVKERDAKQQICIDWLGSGRSDWSFPTF